MGIKGIIIIADHPVYPYRDIQRHLKGADPILLRLGFQDGRFLLTLCHQHGRFLLTLRTKDGFTPLTLCLHLFLHGILDFSWGNNILQLYAVYFDAPGICGDIQAGTHLRVNGLT